MANKSKRVKTDVSSVPELGKDDVIVRLRSELDAERKLNKQLRREKAVEVQQTRELERNEASISLKDLTAKLNHEKQREMEAQREALKCKYEADTCKISKQKDQEIKKLKNDLAKCQDNLREEVTKRGLSTSARGAFELERTKLLLEIKKTLAPQRSGWRTLCILPPKRWNRRNRRCGSCRKHANRKWQLWKRQRMQKYENLWVEIQCYLLIETLFDRDKNCCLVMLWGWNLKLSVNKLSFCHVLLSPTSSQGMGMAL